MNTAITACAVLLGLDLLLWALFVLGAIAATRDRRFQIDAEPNSPHTNQRPSITVLVPARNEEAVIGRMVASVLAQDVENLELIVIDDNSTDNTAHRAQEAANKDPRLHILTGQPLPEGWRGKCWALWQAQQHAKGDLLLFVDADVVLSPFAARRAAETFQEKDLDLLSAWGTWHVESFWERVTMPVVGGFVRGTHPLEAINDPNKPNDAFANGQFIMMSRDAYDRFGGHETIRHEVLEDVELARRAKAQGLSCGMFYAPDLFRVRMYDSLRAVWLGFVKNFYLGMRKNILLASVAAAFLTWTTLFPWLGVLLGVLSGTPLLWGLGAGCLVLMHIFRFLQDTIYRMDPRYGWTHTLGSVVLIGIIVHSAWRGLTGGKTLWKGRAV